jgi:hypothetical protein
MRQPGARLYSKTDRRPGTNNLWRDTGMCREAFPISQSQDR